MEDYCQMQHLTGAKMRFPFWNKKDAAADPGHYSGQHGPAADPHAHERRQFESVLQTFGATRIKERMAILDAFLSVERHLTLADLEELVRRHDPNFHDRAFLRESMEMFCLYGFAQQHTFDARETTFEHHHLGAHHDHFICIRCGSIQEFVNPNLEKMQLGIARDFGFHPLQHKMEVYGICAACMHQRSSILPLTMAANGERVRIVELAGDRRMKGRLASMGLAVGHCLEVISNHPSGPFIVAMEDTRLALSGDIAQHVLVGHHCRHADADEGGAEES
jgi:Fur family ferric uptake transcriptional regulator